MTTGLFPHDNFSSVYWIFTKLDHMIALWKGKNPIYFGVIRSKVKVTITINRIVYRLIIYIDGHIFWCTHFLFLLWNNKPLEANYSSLWIALFWNNKPLEANYSSLWIVLFWNNKPLEANYSSLWIALFWNNKPLEANYNSLWIVLFWNNKPL